MTTSIKSKALAYRECPKIVAQYYPDQSLSFGPEYILPKPFDPRLISFIAPAVAQAAIDCGVATLPYKSFELYKQSFTELNLNAG